MDSKWRQLRPQADLPQQTCGETWPEGPMFVGTRTHESETLSSSIVAGRPHWRTKCSLPAASGGLPISKRTYLPYVRVPGPSESCVSAVRSSNRRAAERRW